MSLDTEEEYAETSSEEDFVEQTEPAPTLSARFLLAASLADSSSVALFLATNSALGLTGPSQIALDA